MAQPQHQLYKEERSIGDLFSELAGETGTLVRQEIALAQVELTKKASVVGTSVGSLAVGGAVGYAGLLAFLAGVVLLLDYVMPAWLAAMIVGLVVGAISYFMVSSSLATLKRSKLAPTESIESIKEDAKWLKQQIG